MSARVRTVGSLVAVGIAVAVGAFVLGHASADAGTARRHGYEHGRVDGYLAGLTDGAVQGRQEGRAAQVPVGTTREAFNSGYSAGANDVFAGYDGGWGLGTPYVVTLERGSGQITYRIATRVDMQRGINFYLCADGRSLCQQRR